MWKKLFGKRGEPPVTRTGPEENTLKARVTGFWRWYSESAERIYGYIENQESDKLTSEVSERVDEFLPDMAWVFGPGAEGQGHSFTLSPEGSAFKRLVVQYWLNAAPKLPGWTFYGSRQPSSKFADSQIEAGGHRFSAPEIWMTPWVDEEEERVDITLWHPKFDQIPENLRWTITFLWLDEALGEDGVINWIGEIKIGDDRLADAIPLAELPQYVAELQKSREWNKLPPHEAVSAYERKEPERGGPLRADVVAGSTSVFELIRDYPLDEDPVGKFGAELLMVVLPLTVFGEDPPVEARWQLGDLLSAELKARDAGLVLGGATGLESAYIDLFLCDGSRSRAVVREVLTAQGLWEGARLAPFVRKPL